MHRTDRTEQVFPGPLDQNGLGYQNKVYNLLYNPLQIKKGYHIIGGCVENGILQKVISEWD